MTDIPRVSRRWLLSIAGSTCVRASVLARRHATASEKLHALEASAGGKLGVCMLDAATGDHVGLRLDERFALCSTFKLLLAGIVLREADAGRLRLDQPVRFTRTDVNTFAPVTGAQVEKGSMAVAALAEAAQVASDNVAANLLLRLLGGPANFTQKLRAIGDDTTRLDRTEPELNLVGPNEVRDTTTPRAMAMTLSRMLHGNLLQKASRDRLVDWMVATTTGSKRLRAGLPASWRAGDKTGTAVDLPGDVGDKYNDVAVAWPPNRGPLVITAYYESTHRSKEIRDDDQAVLAEAGRIAAAWVQERVAGAR